MKVEVQMKERIALLVLSAMLAVAGAAFAQMGFPLEGIKSGTANKLHYTSNATAALTGGGLAQSWFEGDTNVVFRVYARLVGPDGRLLPDESPVLLSTGDNHAINTHAAATSDGNVVIVWLENVGGNDNWNVRAQRLSADGETLWDDGGRVYHEYRGLRNVSAEFIPDFDGGGYLGTRGTHRGDPSWLYALDENGEQREDWPQEGLHSDSTHINIVPTRGGGGWINSGDGLWNRFMPDGSLRWEEGLNPGAPAAIATDGLNLFCLSQLYQNNNYLFSVSVFDTTGEWIAYGEVASGNVGENLLDIQWNFMVAEDGRCYLFVNEVFLEGDIGAPIEMPIVYCNNPLGDNVFPFGEEGIQLQERYERDIIWDANMYRAGETLVIAEDTWINGSPPRVFTLGADGEPVWEDQPLMFDQSYKLGDVAQRTLFNGGQFWTIVDERFKKPGCFSFNGDGEVLTSEEPVWLVPDYRGYLGFIGGWITDAVVFQFLSYAKWPDDGLFRQKIGLDGELEYPLWGDRIREPWNRDKPHDNEFGEVAGHHWLWSEMSVSTGKLILFDDELNPEFERDIEFTEGYPSLRGRTVYEADDHLLLICSNNSGAYTLVRVGLDGEVNDPVRWSLGGIRYAQYWEHHGWLLVSDRDNETQITLLDGELREVWRRRPSLPGWGFRTFGFIEGENSVRFARLKYNSANYLYWVYQSDVAEVGNVTAEDSVQLFEETRSGMDEWFCYPTDDGRFWFHGRQSFRENLVQGVNLDGERLIPNDGLHLRRNSAFVPTTDGGAWVLWDDLDSLRVLRLDEDGRSWRNAYPPEGIGLYNREEYTLLGAALDYRTNRLWAAYQREWKLLYKEMPDELRIQVFGDEWMGVGGVVILHPSSFILSCYPNPFNSTITISISIPEPGPVHLEIYDPLGRRVRELIPGSWLAAGEHNYSWRTSGIPSGGYILKANYGKNERSNMIVKGK